MKTKTFLVTITSKSNAKFQLDQLLKEEVKTEYIKEYELEEVKITYQITEAYEGEIIEEFDDEKEANEKYKELVNLEDGGDYYLERFINHE